jgi:hypothetical protein
MTETDQNKHYSSLDLNTLMSKRSRFKSIPVYGCKIPYKISNFAILANLTEMIKKHLPENVLIAVKKYKKEQKLSFGNTGMTGQNENKIFNEWNLERHQWF